MNNLGQRTRMNNNFRQPLHVEMKWHPTKKYESTMSDQVEIEQSIEQSVRSNVPRVYQAPKGLSRQQILLEVVPKDLKPVFKAQDALVEAVKKIQSKDEKEIIEGIRLGVRLCRFHSEFLITQQCAVNNMIVGLLICLAESDAKISRGSALFFKEVFGARLYYVIEDSQRILLALLTKSAVSNTMVSTACMMALNSALEHLPEQKVRYICGEAGLHHKNVRCRAIATNLVCRFMKRFGLRQFISVHFRYLVVPLTELLMEGDLMVRKGARNIFLRVLDSPKARYILKKHVPSQLVHLTHKSLNELVDQALENQKPKTDPNVPVFQELEPEIQPRLWFR